MNETLFTKLIDRVNTLMMMEAFQAIKADDDQDVCMRNQSANEAPLPLLLLTPAVN